MLFGDLVDTGAKRLDA